MTNQETSLTIKAAVQDAVTNLKAVSAEVRALVEQVKAANPTTLSLDAALALQRLGELRAEIGKFRDEAKNLGKIAKVDLDVAPAIADLKKLAAETSRSATAAKRELEALNRVKVKVPLDQATQEFKNFEAQFSKLESRFRASVDRLNTEARRVTFDPASRSATRFRDSVKIAAENVVLFLSKIPEGVSKDEAAFGRLQQKIEALRIEAQKLSQIQVVPPGGVPAAGSLNTALGNVSSAFEGAASAARLFFFSIVVQKVIEFGKAIVDTAGQLEQFRIRFSTFLGGQQQGAAEFDHLREVADRVGLSVLTLADRFQTYVVAAQAADLSSKETSDLFDAVAISAAGMGQSAEDLSGTLLAFDQILQKGTVQREELIRQLSNRGVPAFELLAKGIGVTTRELQGLLRDGLVPATVGAPALAAEMLKVFGPAAIERARTYRAELARFENALLDVKDGIGRELLPVLSETLRALRDLGTEGKSGFSLIGEEAGRQIEKVNALLRSLNDLKNLNFKDLGRELLALNFDKNTARIQAATAAADLLLRSLEAEVELARRAGLVSEESAAQKIASIEKTREAYKKQSEALLKIPDDIRRGTEAAQQAGEEERKEAQKTAAEIERIRKSLLQSALDAARKQKESEEEITKTQREELLKREDQYTASLKKIVDLSRDPNLRPLDPFSGQQIEAPTVPAIAVPGIGSINTAPIDSLQKKLEDALAAKRELQDQTILSPEDLSRISELGQEIDDLQAKIASLGTAGTQSTGALASGFQQIAPSVNAAGASVSQVLGQQVRSVLKELVEGNAEFAKSFRELGPEAQAGVTSAIGNLENLAASGNLTREALRVLGTQLVDAFATGGLVSQQFAAQFAAAFGTAGATAQTLAGQLQAIADRTLPAVASSSVDLVGRLQKVLSDTASDSGKLSAALAALGPEARASASEAIQSIVDLSTSGNATAEQLSALQSKLVEIFSTGGGAAKQFAIDLSQSLDAVVQGTQKTSEGFIRVRQDSEIGGQAVRAGLYAIGPAADDAAGRVGKIGENFIKVHEGSKNLAPDVTPGIHEIGAASDEASGKVEGLADSGQKVEASFIRAHGASKELESGVFLIGDSAEKAKAQIDGLLGSTDQKAASDKVLADGSQAAAAGVGAVGTAAEAAKAPLSAASQAAKELGESVGKLAEPGQAAAVTALGTSLGTVAGPASQLAGPLGQVAAQARLLGDALKGLGEGSPLAQLPGELTALVAPLAQVVQPAASLTSALSALAEASARIEPEGLQTLGSSATSLSALVDPATAAAGALGPLAAQADTLGSSVATLNAGAESLGANLERIATASASLATALSSPELANGIAALAEGASGAAPGLASVASAAERFSAAVSGASSALPLVVSALQSISDAASKPELRQGVASIADGIDRISRGAGAAAAGLTSSGRALVSIAGSAPRAAEGLKATYQAIDVRRSDDAGESFARLASSASGAADSVGAVAVALRSYRDATGRLKDATTEAIDRFDALRAGSQRLDEELRSRLIPSFSRLSGEVGGVNIGIVSILTNLQSLATVGGDAIDSLRSKVEQLKTALDQANDSAQSLNETISHVKLPDVG